MSMINRIPCVRAILSPATRLLFSTATNNPSFTNSRLKCRTWAHPQKSNVPAVAVKHALVTNFMDRLTPYLDYPSKKNFQSSRNSLGNLEETYKPVSQIDTADSNERIKSLTLQFATQGRTSSELELITVLIIRKLCFHSCEMGYSDYKWRHVKLVERVLRWAGSQQNNIKVGQRLVIKLDSLITSKSGFNRSPNKVSSC